MNTTEMQVPDWRPLEANVPLHHRANYMHMGVCGSIKLNKHRDTRRYLNIDADCVRFFVRKDKLANSRKRIGIPHSVTFMGPICREASRFHVLL